MVDFHFSTIMLSNFSAASTYLSHIDWGCPAIATRECYVNQPFAVVNGNMLRVRALPGSDPLGS